MTSILSAYLLHRTQGGLVLWSRSFTPSPSPFDTLIREALIEERSTSTTSTSSSISTWSKDGYALLWTMANDLELIFVVAYQRILQLSYVDELLLQVKKAFLKAYEDTVRSIVESAKGRDVLSRGTVPASLFNGEGWAKLFEGWEDTFSRILRELELGAAKVGDGDQGILIDATQTDLPIAGHRTSALSGHVHQLQQRTYRVAKSLKRKVSWIA